MKATIIIAAALVVTVVRAASKWDTDAVCNTQQITAGDCADITSGFSIGGEDGEKYIYTPNVENDLASEKQNPFVNCVCQFARSEDDGDDGYKFTGEAAKVDTCEASRKDGQCGE